MTWPRLHPSMECPCPSCAGDRVHLNREFRKKLQNPKLNGEVLLTAPLVEFLRTKFLKESPFEFSTNHITILHEGWRLTISKYSGHLMLERNQQGFTHTIPVSDDATMDNTAADWAEATLKNQ